MNIHKRFSPREIIQNKRFQKFLIALITFLVLFLISSKSIIPQKYNLKVGDIAPVDIKAPRDFVDEMATRQKIQEASDSVSPQYVRDFSVLSNALDNINNYFSTAIEIKALNSDLKDKVTKLTAETNIKLSSDDYTETLQLSNEDLNTLSNFLKSKLQTIMSNDIKNSTDVRNAQDDLTNLIRKETFSKTMKDLATNIGYSLIEINSQYDAAKTNEERAIAIKQVENVVVKKDQNILLKGNVVTAKDIYLMQRAGLLEQNNSVDILIYSGIALLIIMLLGIITWFLYKFKREIYENNSKLVIISSILCINALFIAGINMISGYLIPAGFISILMSLIFDPLLALVVSIPSIIIASCITNFNIEVSLIYAISSISGILFSYKANQRNSVLFSGLSIGLLNCIFILSTGLINNIDIVTNLSNSSMGLAGGILSSILAIGILPVFEQLFDIITPIKLLELSNPNQPLLKKMLFEAPGTYHHSILVGNLAEAAADEIGANSILTRVGAYYHDIGKIKRPYFFKENQITNDNPHDKITPKLSTLIITSHVKDGLELAAKNKLPGAVKDIIGQHHGTTLVRYFYVMAMNDGNEVVEEAAFRYDGPKPSNKESAIVLLADSVEAAARTLNSPTVADIEKIVNKIVKEKIDDGQLADSELTLRDIETTKAAFIKVLVGIFHTRIEYPEVADQTKEEGINL